MIKELEIIFLSLMVVISITSVFQSDAVEVFVNRDDGEYGILFEDNFDDNDKNFSKWSEYYSDEYYTHGVWYEQNQRTELYLGVNGVEGIESISSGPVSISYSNSVNISVDMISVISSDNPFGQIRFQVFNEDGNSISINYYRNFDLLQYKDSSDSEYVTLGYRDDGTWGNVIEIYSNKYRVIMDSFDSGWVYSSEFLSTTEIHIRMYIKNSPYGYYMAGFDNVTIQGINATTLSPLDIYVDDDADPSWYNATHVKTIQEGIYNATFGSNVYVYNGTYYENVVVDKTINLFGEDKNTTKIDGNDNDYTIQISAKWVNISGFNIFNSSYAGISISSEYNIIKNNNINSNYGAILLKKSNNTFVSNIISDNGGGIFQPSDPDGYIINNLFISNNNFINNGCGICIYHGYNSIICNNIFINDGIPVWTILTNNIYNNTVNGKPLLILTNIHDIILGDAGQICLFDCTNVTIENQNLSNTVFGILLVNSNNCSIKNNDFYNNRNDGIDFSNSDDNNIIDNNIERCDTGINLGDSKNNTIVENNVIDCGYGIQIVDSNKNFVIKNYIYDNNYGLFFYHGMENFIVNNLIYDNEYGISTEFKSKNNLFYHNNMIYNSINAHDECSNSWDNGYPLGGNYWTGYSGLDNYHGPNQDIPGSDGIGDIPYSTGWSTQDNYPYMNSFPLENQTPIIFNEYPLAGTVDVERPPNKLQIAVNDFEGDLLDIYFWWENHTGVWTLLNLINDVGNGTYNFIPSGNDWIWGNTTYIWSVYVTDGVAWTNQTFYYTTSGSRYDVNNNDLVNFQDAGLTWVHRTSNAPYDGLYDVNQDNEVNFQDAGLCWVNRD